MDHAVPVKGISLAIYNIGGSFCNLPRMQSRPETVSQWMKYFPLVIFAAVLVTLAIAPPASAHQPFFEETDLTYDAPYLIRDPNVSVAYYATLDSAHDVDYYVLDGTAGQQIFLEMTIPQIAGQENFAPTLAMIGPGFPKTELPHAVQTPTDAGAQILTPPATGRAFFELFSGTSYWDRQKEFVTLPASGRYLIAVWHPEGVVGRYVFVSGTREELGGDLAFPIKMRDYWKPVVPAPSEPSLFERLWQRFIR